MSSESCECDCVVAENVRCARTRSRIRDSTANEMKWRNTHSEKCAHVRSRARVKAVQQLVELNLFAIVRIVATISVVVGGGISGVIVFIGR